MEKLALKELEDGKNVHIYGRLKCMEDFAWLSNDDFLGTGGGGGGRKTNDLGGKHYTGVAPKS